MSIFRAIALLAFVVATVMVALSDGFAAPLLYVSAGLAALTLSGSTFDR